jgi:hypothetical protein
MRPIRLLDEPDFTDGLSALAERCVRSREYPPLTLLLCRRILPPQPGSVPVFSVCEPFNSTAGTSVALDSTTVLYSKRIAARLSLRFRTTDF